MLNRYQNKLNRTVYLSVAILLGLAIFSTFQIQRSHASGTDVVGTAQVAPGFVDGSFDPVIGATSGQIVDNFIQPDGKILIAGAFSTVNGTNKNAIARFNSDGTLDAGFNSGSGPSDAVFSIDMQSDGKIIIGGLFTSYNGMPVGRIARLNADGTLDQTFNTGGVGMNNRTGGNQEITVVKVLPNDKIVIGGTFTNFNGTTQNRIARLNPDGNLDTSFTVGTGANGPIIALALQSDGKIVIGGNFNGYNGTVSPRLARINTDGTFDNSFMVASGANESVMDIIVQPDSKILVSGYFTGFAGFSKNGVVRLNRDGSIDQTFDVAGVDAVVVGIALQADGKILLGGSFSEIASAPRKCLARVNTDGTIDPTFDPGTSIGPQVVNRINLLPNGKPILTGSFTTYNGTANGGAIRINSDGSHDMNIASSSASVGNTWALAQQQDGKIIVGGSFANVGGAPRLNIARISANGSNDATFNPGSGANSPVYAVAVQPDGKMVIGGNFTTYNGAPANRIARVNADGTIDATFATGSAMNLAVESIAIQTDGKIIASGAFTTYNGATVNRFVRLNTNGTLDTTFTTGTGINGSAKSIAFQADGKILMGGQFTTYNGTARNRIARLNTDGTLDTTFDPGTGAANIVNSLALQADGKVVIGGSFTTVNGTARSKVARLNSNGSLDTTFDAGAGPGPGTAAEVTKVLAVENGKTLVAGNFTTFSGSTKTRIARLNPNGSVDHTFMSGAGAVATNGLTIRSLVRQQDGMILIGGQFTAFNTSARSGLARFKNATDTYADLDGDGVTDFSVMRRSGMSGPWTWWVTNSSTGTTEAFEFGASPTDVAQPADYDGDGKDDVAIWRASGGGCAYHIYQSSTNTIRVVPFGQDGDIPMTEDYDGDGRDDLSVWRAPSTTGQATWFYLGSLNNGNNNITFVPWGMRYGTEADQVDKPSTGDFDGDGKADFRVHRRANTGEPSADSAAIIYSMTATGNVTQDYWGWASDKIVPGDYDGDGKTDIAVARGHNASQTIWYIRYSSGIPDAGIHWGAGSSDLFAQGDYDGDGITDLAVYRRGMENTFYVRRSSDQSMMAYNFGATSSDFPVANYNNR